jgi:hypothetical protein
MAVAVIATQALLQPFPRWPTSTTPPLTVHGSDAQTPPSFLDTSAFLFRPQPLLCFILYAFFTFLFALLLLPDVGISNQPSQARESFKP